MNPAYDFSGKVALVTGAGSGIGLAAAQMFARSGAAVALAGVNAAPLEAAAQAIVASGGTAIAITCDVTQKDQVKAMVDRTVRELGGLDYAYNNAGVQSEARDTVELTSAEYDRVVDVNLRGMWLCLRYELEHMARIGSGAIVNCSSMGGLIGLAGRGPYHAAKHGVLGLTKSVGLEYGARGIRVNAVCPGIIDTPMVAGMKAGEAENMDWLMQQVPIRRLGLAEEIAAAVLWLCSPASSFVIGHALVVDGGYTVQ